MSFLDELNTLLFNANTLPTCFYGKYSRLSMMLAVKDGSLQLGIAKALDPENNRGKAEKGEARYDNDNVVNFTLSPNECYHIMTNIKDVVGGTYKNKNPKCDPKYADRFQIVHYPLNADKKTSIFGLMVDKDKRLKITIKPAEGESLSYVLNENPAMGFYERSLFIDMIKNVATQSTYQTELFKSKIKTIRQMFFNMKNNNNTNNNQYSNNKKSYNKSKSNDDEETSTSNESSNDDDDSFGSGLSDDFDNLEF